MAASSRTGLPPLKGTDLTQATAQALLAKQGPTVQKARQALTDRAHEILDRYLKIAEKADAVGNLELAADMYQWLMDHTPAEDGQHMLDPSVDKKQLETSNKPTGPSVYIGLAIGGVNVPQLALSESIIDVEPVNK